MTFNSNIEEPAPLVDPNTQDTLQIDPILHGLSEGLDIINKNKHYYSTDDFNSIPLNDKSLSIISLNINSLRKHDVTFFAFISTLNRLPDIILLSETRHNIEPILNAYTDYNYEVRYPLNNHCGGVATLINKNIDYTLLDDYSISHNEIENIVIKIRTTKGPLILSNIYKHNSVRLTSFKTLFKKHIKSMPIGSSLLIAGDFNIDLMKVQHDLNTANYLNKITALNCSQIIHAPTRITNTSRTLIDHIYIRHKHPIRILRGTFLNQISDHLMTFIIVNVNMPGSVKERPDARIFSERNIIKFKNSLTNIENVISSNELDSNAKWDLFLNLIQKRFDESFPLKKLSKTKCKDKYWITNSIKKSTRIKEKLFKIWKINPTTYNRNKYISYKNCLNKIINNAKKMHYLRIFSDDKNNKKTWQEINKLLNGNNSSNLHIESLKLNEVSVTDANLIADILNKHFSSVGDKMNNAFNSIADDTTFNIGDMPDELNCSILLRKTNHSEISKIFDNLSDKNSAGLDKIPQKIIKLVKDKLTPAITYLINCSISDKTYPVCLKIAKIIPIYKSKDKDDFNNYRPISLLSVFNKIFERKLHNDLVPFIEKNEILFANQFGFRKFHSTIDALIKMHDYIIHNRRKNKKIIGIFLDLSKAFDSIDNDILIQKLLVYGVRGPFNDLIKSYLSDRKCLTSVNLVQSSVATIKFGVPQGSILGPLLFSLYVNDIKTLSNNAEINLFADDTNLFCTGNSYAEVIRSCNEVLKACSAWLYKNKLTLNVNKTHYVDFSKNKICDVDKVLKFNNASLTENDHTNYLGMTFQHDLKWDSHIKALINKINSRIPLYYQIRNLLPKEKKVIIYNSLTLSNIIYGIELYGKRETSLIKCLQKTQNRMLKILFLKNIRTSTNELHKNLDILKLKDLAEIRTLLIAHKVIYDKDKTNISHSDMILSNRTRNLRSTNIFETTAQFFEYSNKITDKAAIVWNNLPT